MLPKILETTLVATSRLFKIEAVSLLFNNGNYRIFERFVAKRQAVMVLPILQDGTMLLVREYAAGTEKYEITFPKGIIDDGETIESAARRELQEEVGYDAKSWCSMKQLASAPGYATSKMQILVANDLFPSKLAGDEPEPLELVYCKPNEVSDFLLKSDFVDAISIAAMLMYTHHQDNFTTMD